MKDTLFEMLLNLFEKTLTQLKEKHQANTDKANDGVDEKLLELANGSKTEVQIDHVRAARAQSMRVLTHEEQNKLTKASYQFLMRMVSLGIIASETFELILNRLLFSDSRFVSLQETKWTIRNTLADGLDAEQLAFLELVLYQKEDGLPLH